MFMVAINTVSCPYDPAVLLEIKWDMSCYAMSHGEVMAQFYMSHDAGFR